MPESTLPTSHDKVLYTPGPLTTSLAVKQAMLHDAGSWHWEFNALVKSIRDRLVALAGLDPHQGWEAILLQGSGTFGVEAVLASVVPHRQGPRARQRRLRRTRRAHAPAPSHSPRRPIAPPRIPRPIPSPSIAASPTDPAISHVVAIHCETTTGVLNPIEPWARRETPRPGLHRRRHEQLRRRAHRLRGLRHRLPDLLRQQVHRRRAGLLLRPVPPRRPRSHRRAGPASSASTCSGNSRASIKTASSATRRPPTPSSPSTRPSPNSTSKAAPRPLPSATGATTPPSWRA
jgi:hypothetical protein